MSIEGRAVPDYGTPFYYWEALGIPGVNFQLHPTREPSPAAGLTRSLAKPARRSARLLKAFMSLRLFQDGCTPKIVVECLATGLLKPKCVLSAQGSPVQNLYASTGFTFLAEEENMAMGFVEKLLELEDTSPDIVDFRTSSGRVTLRLVDVALLADKMENLDGPPIAQTTGLNPVRHGNWAQWAAVSAAVLIALINMGFTLWFHHTENATKASDEHIGTLIESKMGPKIKEVSTQIATELTPINSQLISLTQQVGQLQGRFQQLDARQKKLGDRLTQQETLNRLQDPRRILATIRAEIDAAETRSGILPVSQLADYRVALRDLPSSVADYWTTVAAVINYQSLLNQMSGEAPDPTQLSKACAGLTNEGNIRSTGNIFINDRYSKCFVDLDTQVFDNVTFQNSVIRYHGGPVSLKNVTFVNCRFVLEVAAPPGAPSPKKLLMALLDSPDQKTVQVPN